jgi:hypothetical protein
VYYATVVAGLMRSNGIGLLEHDHPSSWLAREHLARHRQTENARADDGTVVRGRRRAHESSTTNTH